MPVQEMMAAIELGGTKILAAVGTDPLAPSREVRIPTRDPAETLASVSAFFEEARKEYGALAAAGIASFGPINLRRGSPLWGHMGSTPKPGWQNANVGPFLEKQLGCPANLDTDVNAAGLAEARWGAGRGLDSIIYLTVGTGIGGGLVIDGRSVQGALHPEVGHVRIKKHPGDPYPSRCPFHEDCAEGLASGPAIIDRFGRTLPELAPDHPFHGILSDYLGQLCATLVLVVSPQRIIIGGGVMSGSSLHAQVFEAMLKSLNGYLEPGTCDPFVTPPALGDRAGIAGAFALAQNQLRSRA
jgi:fructokinase